jgi:hypothetical protein
LLTSIPGEPTDGVSVHLTNEAPLNHRSEAPFHLACNVTLGEVGRGPNRVLRVPLMDLTPGVGNKPWT